MSSGAVTNRVKSSAYATTAVFVVRPILIPVSLWSSRCSNGFKTKAKSNMLKGHPCRTEHCMGIGPVVCPLIWIEVKAWSYTFCMRVMNCMLNPYLFNILKRYVWEVLSKASVKSKERMHSGACVISACHRVPYRCQRVENPAAWHTTMLTWV
jgi:hypothetical protein